MQQKQQYILKMCVCYVYRLQQLTNLPTNLKTRHQPTNLQPNQQTLQPVYQPSIHLHGILNNFPACIRIISSKGFHRTSSRCFIIFLNNSRSNILKKADGSKETCSRALQYSTWREPGQKRR